MSNARFIISDYAIINIDDISTVVPVATSDPDKLDGVRITFMSKGTFMVIENATVADIAKQIQLASQYAS